jgi:hypothetical protein
MNLTLILLKTEPAHPLFDAVCKKGAESLHPLDAELNLPDERYSLELRRRVAEEAAKNSFDETLDVTFQSRYPILFHNSCHRSPPKITE